MGESKMHIAVCDDNERDLACLRELIANYAEHNSVTANIHCFSSGEALLGAFERGKYQILFQDIFMSGISGMQAAEQIRAVDRDIAIVLTTTSEEFGVASYAIDAAYYIVKPVTAEKLEKALARCRDIIRRHARYIEVIEDRQQVRLILREILFVEVVGKYCEINLAQRVVRARMRLEELAGLLGGSPFVRCHRSYIVNLNHVQQLQNRDCILPGGKLIPISRTHCAGLERALADFLRAKAAP